MHSSSDGQKFETNINTINSRHSPKYFGLKAYQRGCNHSGTGSVSGIT
ncbi:transposase [Clostridium estertheticum]|nr:transposase [Clostridium estertheticum]